jgi:hypothetical protein
MDSRTNGHRDPSEDPAGPGRPRLPADGRAPRRSSVDSLRAADQLARLEARIREFHRNLDALESAPAGSDSAARADPGSRTGAGPTAGTDSDLLVRRAAAAARLAVSSGETPIRRGESEPGADGDRHRNGNSAGPPRPPGTPPPAVSNGDTGHRRRRSDRSSDPLTPQRRIDSLRPNARRLTAARPVAPTPAAEPADSARATAERIRREAESGAQQLRQDAEHEADRIRDSAEREMQELWQALESEVQTIQTEISQRVDALAVRMEAVSREADLMRVLAEEEAEQIHHSALDEADQIRALASHDADDLLSLAEREAHALIAEARSQGETLLAEAEARLEFLGVAPEPDSAAPAAGTGSLGMGERSAAERIAEQIREATAALTRRVSRAVEDPSPTRVREIRGPAIVPASIRELLDGLVSAVSLIERSLIGLADLLGDTLGAEPPENR